MCPMGCSCGYSKARKKEDVTVTASVPHEDVENEGTGQITCLVDRNVEMEVQQCVACRENSKAPSTAPLPPWEWPEKPWTRLNVV